jgi:hypothetical protein
MGNEGQSVFERNLAALGPRSAKAIAHIRAAPPRTDLSWTTAPDGAATASMGSPPRQLASLRAPLAEADKFAAGINIAAAACVVVRGFGLGHHIAALARRLKQHGAVIVFEPDTALLRAVLERIDCTPWLRLTNLALITDPEDTGAIAAAATGIEAILAAGTTLVDHPPSTARLAPTADRFAQGFTNVMKALRTNVVTTLVQVDASVRNVLLNLSWYATRPGIADLAGVRMGRPAVVVSAGPSLRRNIDLLARPGVRDRVVIIAVQTVLKTLLAKGIKPHFVTALDYHEISKRFYEGLTREGVEGVTLVVEPKCNRAILEAFPGDIRCVADHVLDQVLGPLARPMGDLPPGATVSHLAYYLARHLGCDPVILVGQDLGFTDGQYYAPGAAIHQVWSSELNEFRTLEMLEWERIARMRSLLRKAKDQQGRDIYTDEQMSTYLVQFERDFMHDAARGLTTIDATEGGVFKQHTEVMPLHEALERCAADVGAAKRPGSPQKAPSASTPQTPAPLPAGRLDDVASRLRTLRQSTDRIASHARAAKHLLQEMLDRQRDIDRVNALITKVNELATQAVPEPAYWLVQYINQTGQFNRFRADRAIHIDPSLGAMDKQRKEIERDITNVQWLADAADHVGELLDKASERLNPLSLGGTDGEAWSERRARPSPSPISAAPLVSSIWALIQVDPTTSALGTPRDLSRPFLLGLNPLQMTLARLAQCKKLAGAILLTPDPGATRRLIGTPPKNLRLELEQIDPTPHRERARAIAAARLWSRHCWRGGIANISCYDEAFCPALASPIMQRRAIDAAVILGADWSLIDPRLIDEVIQRHLDRPDTHQLTFTQAPPGLGAALIGARAAKELAAAATPLATIGGLLGYIPIAPQSDPIAKPVCVATPPHCRDLLARCIPDSQSRRAALGAALKNLGPRVLSADAPEVAAAISALTDAPGFGLEMVTLEATPAFGPTSLGPLAGLADDVALTVITDERSTQAAFDLVPAARRAGFAGVHVRGPLTSRDRAKALLDAAPDVVSVICGPTNKDAATEAATLDWMIEQTQRAGALSLPWIVPRLTRSDAACAHIEPFYDRWIMTTGAAVIDPPASPGERIEPLPVPANVLARARTSALVIRRDATVTDGQGSPLGNLKTEDLPVILARTRLSVGSKPARQPISKAS